MAAVLALPKGALPASPRHVLTVLAWHCNELAVRRGQRECWPSLNTLSKETSLDRTTCMRAIDALAERRYVEVDRHARVGNRYRVTDPKTWPTRGVAQPAAIPAGGVTQPAGGRAGGVTPPLPRHQVQMVLRNLAEQVARRHQTGCATRLKPELGTSERERSEKTKDAEREGRGTPRQRSREEQLACVQTLSEGMNPASADGNDRP